MPNRFVKRRQQATEAARLAHGGNGYCRYRACGTIYVVAIVVASAVLSHMGYVAGAQLAPFLYRTIRLMGRYVELVLRLHEGTDDVGSSNAQLSRAARIPKPPLQNEFVGTLDLGIFAPRVPLTRGAVPLILPCGDVNGDRVLAQFDEALNFAAARRR